MNEINYKVIDDYLPKKLFKELKNKIMGNMVPWFFQSEINKVHDKKDLSCYFTHLVFYNQTPLSQIFPEINQIFREKLDVKSFIRIKLNCYPRTQKIEIHEPHVDENFEHKSAIFYINTNDGYTILDNKVKIESIENRVLFFKSYELHSSTSCTNQKARFNINFNYF
jgi:hypothetical protein